MNDPDRNTPRGVSSSLRPEGQCHARWSQILVSEDVGGPLAVRSTLGSHMGDHSGAAGVEDARERITRVFRYLRDLNLHRNPAKRLIQDQLWRLPLAQLP